MSVLTMYNKPTNKQNFLKNAVSLTSLSKQSSMAWERSFGFRNIVLSLLKIPNSSAKFNVKLANGMLLSNPSTSLQCNTTISEKTKKFFLVFKVVKYFQVILLLSPLPKSSLLNCFFSKR